jgi:hypothetical protein
MPVEFRVLPEEAKKEAEKFGLTDGTCWDIVGTDEGQRGLIIGALRRVQNVRFTVTGKKDDDPHFLIVAKSADKAKVEETASRALSYVPRTPEQRSADVRKRCVGNDVWIPGIGIVSVFPNFNSRKRQPWWFKEMSVVFPEKGDPFYYKRPHEEDVELPAPDTWVVLYKLMACWHFINCAKQYYELYSELLGGVKLYSVLKDYAPKKGLPATVNVAKNKNDKYVLGHMIPNALLACLGYPVPQDQLSGYTKVIDIARLFKPPSRDDDFDMNDAFVQIRSSLAQKAANAAVESAERRAAAAAILAGTATQNSFSALQEDVGPSSASPSVQDPKEFPVLGAQAPKPQGAWRKRKPASAGHQA